MTAQLIDGKDLQRPIVERVTATLRETGLRPRLALLTVEHPVPQVRLQTDPAFDLHVAFLGRLGIDVRPHRLPAETTNEELLALIGELNADDEVDGIFLLVPPPPQIDMVRVVNAIDPAKELEGLHPEHAARLLPASLVAPERAMIVPATLRTVFDSVGIDFEGAHIVIVMQREAARTNLITHTVAKFGSGLIWPNDSTLTVVHHEYPQLAELTRQADVLITVLPGLPGLVKGDWVKPGAAVFDFAATVVGTQPHPADPDRVVPVFAGGVDNDAVAEVAKVLCPAPRGFGPVMLALLAENLVQAAVLRRAVRS